MSSIPRLKLCHSAYCEHIGQRCILGGFDIFQVMIMKESVPDLDKVLEFRVSVIEMRKAVY